MDLYKHYLSLIEKAIGDEQTFSSQLDTIGSFLFPKKWVGVFPKDKIPSLDLGYMIVNLDGSSAPGSHWIAIADNMFYDSFGRHSKNLGFSNKSFVNTEDDPEQKEIQSNCGARCLAFLCVFHVAGRNIASTI